MVIFPAMTKVGALFLLFVVPVVPPKVDDDDADDEEDDDGMVLSAKGLTNDKRRLRSHNEVDDVAAVVVEVDEVILRKVERNF